MPAFTHDAATVKSFIKYKGGKKLKKIFDSLTGRLCFTSRVVLIESETVPETIFFNYRRGLGRLGRGGFAPYNGFEPLIDRKLASTIKIIFYRAINDVRRLVP